MQTDLTRLPDPRNDSCNICYSHPFLGQLSYGLPLGPVLIQFRPAEAPTVLPILFPEAVPALFLGSLSPTYPLAGWI